MRNNLCLVLAVLMIMCCFCGCNSHKVDDKLVVRVLEKTTLILEEHHRQDGDFVLGDAYHRINGVWNGSGCVIQHDGSGLGGDEDFEVPLTLGEQVMIEIPGTPYAAVWWCCLSHEDDPLPEEWQIMLDEKAAAEEARAAYGTFEDYLAYRDVENDIAIIEKACNDCGHGDQNAEEWYEFFALSLWKNCDFDVKIKEVSITTDGNWPNSVLHMTIIDNNGRVFDIWHAGGSWSCSCNGEPYHRILE